MKRLHEQATKEMSKGRTLGNETLEDGVVYIITIKIKNVMNLIPMKR